MKKIMSGESKKLGKGKPAAKPGKGGAKKGAMPFGKMGKKGCR